MQDVRILPEERLTRFERRVPDVVAHYSDQSTLYHNALGATRRFSTGVLRGRGGVPALRSVTRNGLFPEVFRDVASGRMGSTALR
jgi:hypothetical protein